MNGVWPARFAAIVTAVTVQAGCSTPVPIRQLADQGAATVGLAEASLRQYLALTHAQLSARMELLRYEAEQLSQDRANRELDLRLDERAGLPAADAAAGLILSLGEDQRRVRERHAAQLAGIEKEMALDVATLTQVPAAKLATARRSFSALAQELSPREWVRLYVDYAREIHNGIEQLDPPGAQPVP